MTRDGTRKNTGYQDIKGQKQVMRSGNWSYSVSQEHWVSVGRTCGQIRKELVHPAKEIRFSWKRLN